MRPIQLFLQFIHNRLEVPRQQRLDVLDGCGCWQMFEQIVQVRVGLNVIDAACRHQREQVGARLGAAGIVAEEPGFSARRKVFDLLLAVIVTSLRQLHLIRRMRVVGSQ